MFHFYPLFHIPMILSGLSLLILAWIAWRKPSPVRNSTALLMISLSIWTLATVGEMTFDSLNMKFLWVHLSYLGIGFTPYLWFLFTIDFTGQRSNIRNRTLLLLALLPLSGILSCWTNGLHHLYYLHTSMVTSHGVSCLVLTHGPLFRLFMTHSYAFELAGFITLARSFPTSNHLFRRQMATVALGASFPLLSNILYLAGFCPIPGFDITPISFIATGISIIWGVRYCHLWSMTPIAHRIILHTIADGIIVLDSEHRIVELNPAASRLISFSEYAVVGQTIESAIPNKAELYDALGNTQNTVELTISSPTAPFGLFEVTITPFYQHSSWSVTWILVFHNRTERHRLEERLHFLAFYDSLTCLPNRELFTVRLEELLAKKSRDITALMYIDLDSFKQINDTLGHSEGDNLLREVARRLNEKCRSMEMIARLCGDEFAVICSGLHGKKDAAEAATQIMSAFSEPFELPCGPMAIRASMGCIFIPHEDSSVDSLLHNADVAMYDAKRSGGGCFRFSKDTNGRRPHKAA